jgi:outer membrane lipoprotein-sorting protein
MMSRVPQPIRTALQGLNRGVITPTVLVFCLVLATGAAVPVRADKALQILEKSIHADGRIPFAATVEICIYHGGRQVMVHRQRVLHGGDNRQRVEALSPGPESGRLIVSNGRYEWEYHPKMRNVNRRELLPLAEIERHKLGALRLVQGTLHATYLGVETIAGRKCHVIAVKPPDGRVVRKKVWVDADRYVELKWVRYDAAGQVTASWTVLQVDVSPSLSAAQFEFRPPAGVAVRQIPRAPRMSLAVAEKKLGFRAILPGYLPPGYVLHSQQVAITNTHGRVALWLQFINGVDTFSIFQARGGLPPKMDRVMSWEARGFAFVLVGNLPQPERDRVRNSVH